MWTYVRGAGALLSVSFILALINSCSLNNNILKPSCLIFHIDLVERWWQPKDANNSDPAVFFYSNGRINISGLSDSLTYTLTDCNSLDVTNHAGNHEEQWLITKLTSIDLDLQYPNGRKIAYYKRQ